MKSLTLVPVVAVMSCLLIGGAAFGSERDREGKQRHEESEVVGEITAKMHGTVEKLPASGLIGTWIVKGRKVNVTNETHIDERQGKVAVGVYIEVEGNSTGGTIDAFEIEVEGKRVLHGKIEKLPLNGLAGTWVVDGKKVNVTRETHIDMEDREKIAVGVLVDIEGEIKGGTIEAFEVEVSGPAHK